MPPAMVSFSHANDLPRVDSSKVPNLIERMKAIVGPENVLTSRAALSVYECDGFTIDKNKPDVVML
jgi:glycolate oxidase